MPVPAVDIRGAKELERKLLSLERKSARKVLTSAVRGASAEPRKDVRRNVPVESGALKKSIVNKVKRYRRGAFVLGVIGARSDRTTTFRGRERRPSKYFHLIEDGVRPHTIAGTKFGTVRHPGFRGRNTARKAFDRTRKKAESVFGLKFGKAFEREAAKQR